MLMMQKMHQMMVRRPSATAGYVANAVHFDGANDRLTKSSAISSATSSTFSFACWLNLASDPVDFSGIIVGNGTNYNVELSIYPDGSDFRFYIYVYSAITGSVMDGYSDIVSAPTGWFPVLFSVNSNFGAGSRIVHLYRGDTEMFGGWNSDSGSAFSLDYSTISDWDIGSPSYLTEKLNGDMAELWFSTDFLDFSVEANRRKFVSSVGKPVSLGVDGSLPTGSAPAIYLPGDYTNFEINAGTGGNFTEVGALTAAATSPSD